MTMTAAGNCGRGLGVRIAGLIGTGLTITSEAEHEQHGGARVVLEFRRERHDVQGLLRPCQHGDILLSVDREADRRRIDAGWLPVNNNVKQAKVPQP